MNKVLKTDVKFPKLNFRRVVIDKYNFFYKTNVVFPISNKKIILVHNPNKLKLFKKILFFN